MFLSGFVHSGSGFLSAVLLAGLLPWGAARAEGAVMEYDVVCIAATGTDQRLSEDICEGFLQLLRSSYPDRTFTSANHSSRQPRLDILISQASGSAAALQLVWTDRQGVQSHGGIESVSAMDRQLSSSMKQSLYRQALMASPLPE